MKNIYLVCVLACIIFLIFVHDIIHDIGRANIAIMITGILMLFFVIAYSLCVYKEKK